ncbi:hypothetical protein OBV_13870 [Oscillibacter valericigenes Sjm18-20]|nr:hypothetical protein OBV_13870 [Oscillibacter valericigenes Sjm18-20]
MTFRGLKNYTTYDASALNIGVKTFSDGTREENAFHAVRPHTAKASSQQRQPRRFAFSKESS